MWVIAAIAVASLIYTYLNTPRPSVAVSPKPEDVKAPTVDEGAPISVVFGTVEIKNPAVVQFGEVNTYPVKSDGATVGHKYYVNLGMILCHGPVDKIKGIYADGKRITDQDWGYEPGTAGSGLADGYLIAVDRPNLFGGELQGGGAVGMIPIGFGAVSEGPDTGEFEHYPYGLCYMGLSDFYYGTSPYIKPISARVQRILRTSSGSLQWYPEKAIISVGKSFSDYWKYLLTTSTSDTYAETAFPDFSWPYGLGGFGSVMSGDFPSPGTIVSAGGVGQRIWLRHDLGAIDPQTMVLDIWHDDGASAWFNGVALTLESVSLWHSICTIPVASINSAGPNVIAVRVVNGVPSGTATRIYVGASVLPARLKFSFGHGLSMAANEVDTPVDMNPAHIVLECLVDTVWGAAVDPADIDYASFTRAADTLYGEKCGISLQWNKPATIYDFIKEILRHINGEIYISRTTGKHTITLIRDDYATSDLLQLDEASIIKIESLTRKAPGECLNKLSVKYSEGLSGETGTVVAMDQGLIQTEGATVSGEQDYPGFTNRQIAAKAALRDLAVMSTPARSCVIYATRKAARLNITDPFIVSWPQLGLSGQPTAFTSDPLHASVLCLIPYNDSDFTDSTGRSVTAKSSGRNITTKYKKYGNSSLGLEDAYYTGSETGEHDVRDFGENNSLMSFALGDFCVEAWVRVVHFQTQEDPVGIIGHQHSGSGWNLAMSASGSLVFYAETLVISAPTAQLNLRQWHHIAASRQAGTLRFFVDGVLKQTSDCDIAIYCPLGLPDGTPNHGVLTLGRLGPEAVGQSFSGQIDDVRVTGDTRYTQDFVPPMSALPGPPVDGVVMRVAALSFGNGLDNTVKITAIEDIFTIPKYSLTAVPDAWSPPVGSPPAPGELTLMEMPYHEIVRLRGRADADAVIASNPTMGMLMVAGDRVSGAVNGKLYVSPTGTTGALSLVGDTDLAPWAMVTGGVSRVQTVLPYSASSGLSAVTLGSYAILSGGEIVVVTAVDTIAATVTVGRGCLDTVPTLLDSSAMTALGISSVKITFIQDFYRGDNRQYITGNAAGALILPANSRGVYPLRALVVGTDPELVFGARANRPYPPGDLRVGGIAYPDTIQLTGDLVFTWAHRDRKTQADFFFGQVLDTLAASIGPEIGTTYTIRFYDSADTLLQTVTGITGETYTKSVYRTLQVAIVNASPVAYYRLGEPSGTVSSDETSNNLDGTYANCMLGTAGLDNSSGDSAVTFNGTTSSLTVLNSSVFNTPHLSVFAIIRTSNTTTTGTIASRDSAIPGSDRQFQLRIDSGKLRCYVFSGSNNEQSLESPNSVADGNPHTVGFSYDNTTGAKSFKLYVDGAIVASATGNISLCQSAEYTLQIGNFNYNYGTPLNFFNGVIDEVAIFPDVVTTAEMLALHVAARSDNAIMDAELRVELEAVRNGIVSHTKHNLKLTIS
jgi:hypothetical protein